MIKEFEKYHAVVLRSLVTQMPDGVRIQAKDAHGTVNCFQVNGKVGLMIKHSSKRMSPYTFTFTEENLLEFNLLAESSEKAFMILVCGWDGFLTISKDELETLSKMKMTENTISIHVTRRKRGMYTVGGRTQLRKSKPKGFSSDFFQALEK